MDFLANVFEVPVEHDVGFEAEGSGELRENFSTGEALAILDEGDVASGDATGLGQGFSGQTAFFSLSAEARSKSHS